MMNTLAIIPARGGSKGIHRKNIRPLMGQPLIVYAIEAARKSKLITDVVVSTDDREIADIAEANGAEVVRRPPELAGDTALVMDAVRHCLKLKEDEGKTYGILVLLEPTAPLRTGNDIDETILKITSHGADSAATFSETDVPPTRIWKIRNQTPEPYIPGADPFLPRQQQDKGFYLNGMVYALKTELLALNPDSNSFFLGKTAAHVIPKERAVDIDTELDFIIAEKLMQSNK